MSPRSEDPSGHDSTPGGEEKAIGGHANPDGRDKAETEPSARRHREVGWPNQRTLLLYLVGGLLIAAIPVAASRLVDQPDGEAYTIDIPPGTAERLAAGEDVEIVPDELDFKLRDLLIIVNRDSVKHTIGPFEVGPGETSEHTFGEAAAFNSYCSLHPAGSIRISIGE
ncbi:hypothetical protein [Candidatus Poriferisodalis sp.]|uniref:hypothetical protein n=1 Tax=Candidatus Poriferisodalis sp. TaxID=3101277 RepID=UPI003B52F253